MIVATSEANKGCDFSILFEIYAGYSGSHGGVVGSVIVSNLKTGVRRGGWDKAEVHITHGFFCICFSSLSNIFLDSYKGAAR